MRYLLLVTMLACKSPTSTGYDSKTEKLDRGIDTQVTIKNSDSNRVHIEYNFYLNYPDTIYRDTNNY